MKLRAADYLIKDARPQEILLTIERVLRLDALRRENAQLRRVVRKLHGFGELIGESASMREVYRVIGAVSQNKSTVLVSGESGTGKELVARTIHRRGPLAEGPFVAINCAGLSETLLDSQLFGHRRGAFTGAVADHDGVFRAAEGGTLFLDEVSEIPLGLQARFLRALQDREVTPLGSSRPITVDVRLIAATNRDLEAETRAGRFRSDLFYRLNVVHIGLPPLRARADDVVLLIEHFIQHFSREYQVAPKRVAPEAMARLRAYAWPGNIRELQNAIERAFALSGADTITLNDLPAALRDDAAPSLDAPDGGPLPTLREPLRRLELPLGRDHLGAALALGLGLTGHRAAHLIGQVDELDRDLHHLDAPGLGVLVDDRLQVGVDLLPLREQLVQLGLTAHAAQRGLRVLRGGEEIVLHLDDGAVRVDHAEVEARVHLERDVVLGDDVLGRDVHGDRPEIDAHRLLDPGDDIDDPGAARPDQASQPEDDRPLVLAQHLEPANQEDDHDQQRGPRTRHGYLLSTARDRARRTRSRSPSTAVTSIGSPASTTSSPSAVQYSPRTSTVPAGARRLRATPTAPTIPSAPTTEGRRCERTTSTALVSMRTASVPPTPKTRLRGTATPVSAG